jgi:hypothetical protein
MVYHISYICFQIWGLVLACYDLYANGDNGSHIADNIISVILVVVVVFSAYVRDLGHMKGDICLMPVALWGMPFIMSHQLIWTCFYLSPLNGTFFASAFAGWLLIGVLAILFWVGVLCYKVGQQCFKSLSHICKNCGHIEEREEHDIDIDIIV